MKTMDWISLGVVLSIGTSTAASATTRQEVAQLYKQLDQASRSQASDKSYVFDPEDLHAISKKGIGLPREQMLNVVQEELMKRYPGKVSEKRRWILNFAGGAMGELTVLHCSAKEYLIFFGSPIGTEGHSGRYKSVDIWDFVMEGEMQTYIEGDLSSTVSKPGDYGFLERDKAKGYKIQGDTWMLEYARGNILSAFNFGIVAPTKNLTLDWKSAWNQLHDCAQFILPSKTNQ